MLRDTVGIKKAQLILLEMEREPEDPERLQEEVLVFVFNCGKTCTGVTILTITAITTPCPQNLLSFQQN